MNKPNTAETVPAQTLSDDYRRQLTEKHATDNQWGNTGIAHYARLLKLIKHFNAKSVLDYGCGKGMVGKKFREDQATPGFNFPDVAFYEYDPGIPDKMHDKSQADLLISTDVMEHIEPEYLDSVLADMAHRTLHAAFILISCVPAIHRLPDGRNAHLIIEHPNWWIEQLNKHFNVTQAEYHNGELYTLVMSKNVPLQTPEPDTKKKLTEDDKAIKQAQAHIENKKYTKARALLLGLKNKAENPESIFLLGKIYFETNDLTKAAEYFLEYGQYKKTPEAYRMAGICLSKIERYKNALKCLELDICKNAYADDEEYIEALMLCWNKSLKPDTTIAVYEHHHTQTPKLTVPYIDALIIGQSHNKALEVAEKAVKDNPDNAELCSALERVYAGLRQFEKSLNASQKAADLEPDNAVYLCNLGLSYLSLARVDEALDYFNKATAIDPLMMAPYLNRSTIRRFRKDYDHLEQELLTALELDPVSPDVHYALGVNALKQEQYERAFTEIEWYWHKNLLTSTRMPTSMPRWYGEDITGKSIMIYADQGVGDILMMLRYVPIIAAKYKPAKMIINTNAKMHDIVTNSFPELFASGQAEIYKNVISAKDAPIDYIIAVMTIPHVLGTAIDTIPAPQGYLKKRNTLDYKTDKDFVIGISWYTKSLDAGFIRSLKLMDFSFLAKYKNVRVLDLQYGDTAAERADAKTKGFDIHHDDTIDTWAELQPLLDQIASCDLVISIDNTTVHAAGAIGTPCWTILPQESYWRWPIAGESTPWYESLRLYRQKDGESYESLFATIEAEFKKFLNGDASTLTPPKFKRLFAEQPKPEKTALLINDTGSCFTWGNFASMEGIKNSLTTQGYTVESISTLGLDWFAPKNPSLQDFDDPKYLAACRYRNPTLFWQMEKADAVIINGEGMLNELTDTALHMLYLAYVAKHFYKRHVRIINHSCFPEGGPNLTNPQNLAFYHKVYTTIDGCVAREQVTYDLLKSIGANNVELGLDASLLWLKKHQETAAQITKTKTAIITAGPGYGSNYAEAFGHLCKKLRANGLKPILLHGAKWHVSQEDNMLAEDLKELYPDITIIKAKTADEFMEHLSAAKMVFSGFLPISLMAHALGCQSVPFTTGSNGLSMIGMAKNCCIPAPLFYEDPNIEKKLEAAIKNTGIPTDSLDKLADWAEKNVKFR